jgi:hypothetical protein
MIVKGIFGNLWAYMKSPAERYKALKVEPDAIVPLFIVDTWAFFVAAGAVLNGTLPFSLTFTFAGSFIILYLLLFILLGMMVGFEAMVAHALCNYLHKPQLPMSMLAAFGYAKLPVLIGSALALFLPERACLTFLIPIENMSMLKTAFCTRVEVFEVLSFVLAVIAVKVVADTSKLQALAVTLLGWIGSTAIFYTIRMLLHG